MSKKRLSKRCIDSSMSSRPHGRELKNEKCKMKNVNWKKTPSRRHPELGTDKCRAASSRNQANKRKTQITRHAIRDFARQLIGELKRRGLPQIDTDEHRCNCAFRICVYRVNPWLNFVSFECRGEIASRSFVRISAIRVLVVDLCLP